MTLREEITNSIVEAMEKGTLPWRKSWVAGSVPYNMTTGNKYSGINFWLLSMQSFNDPRFLTQKQAESLGLAVPDDAVGTRIVRMVEVNRNNPNDAKIEGDEVVANEGRKALVLRSYRVYNASQIEGIAPLPLRECDVTCADAVEDIIYGLQKTGLKVNFGQGYSPAYYARSDEVRICPANQFNSLGEFQSVLLHEAAGHGSQHPKRLAMMHTDVPKFGSTEYARLELIAELTSAQLGAELGLPMPQSLIDSHASYIASWLEVLRGDRNEIFRAANAAQRICDYVTKLALEAEPPRPVKKIDAVEDTEPEPALAKSPARPSRRKS